MPNLFTVMVVFWIFLVPAMGFAAPGQPDGAVELLRKIDRLYRAEASRAELTMTVKTPDWTRELRLRAWSEGMNKTLIRILAPKKDEGVATLRIENQMWNYFPKVNKVIKVPPSMMMGSWMGSDFTNDDLVRESSLVEDYNVSMTADREYQILALVPKKDVPTVWAKIEIRIDRATMLPVDQSYFDEKGRKARIMRFKEIKELGGRRIPSVMELTPLLKEEHLTVIKYESMEFNPKLDRDLFSLKSLQSGR